MDKSWKIKGIPMFSSVNPPCTLFWISPTEALTDPMTRATLLLLDDPFPCWGGDRFQGFSFFRDFLLWMFRKSYFWVSVCFRPSSTFVRKGLPWLSGKDDTDHLWPWKDSGLRPSMDKVAQDILMIETCAVYYLKNDMELDQSDMGMWKST